MKNEKQKPKEIKYNNQKWIICVNLKTVNFLLGQQPGYTEYPCLLCLWDSHAFLISIG